MTTRDGKPYALQTKTGKEITHGSSNAYTSYGCRCGVCTAKRASFRQQQALADPERFRAYGRKWARDNREKMYATRAAWRKTEKGQQSEAAWAKNNPRAVDRINKRAMHKRAEREKLTQKKAFRAGLPYTPEEDALLLECPVSLVSAIEMGRSLKSAQNRRNKLLNLLDNN